jgi:pimeloyl-ACP methyl ester carboxylesterase
LEFDMTMTSSATRSSGLATAENLTIDASNGVSYAYRRLVEQGGARPPLLLLQHFRGNLDTWDPLLIDSIATASEVILVDNAGVGLSSGTVPRNVTQMARDAIAFADALGLSELDLLGYSLGGMVAQEVALLRPRLVRRLILAATGPRGGGRQMHGWIRDIEQLANAEGNGPDELLRIFFELSESSRQRGREYLGRISSRQENRDRTNGLEVKEAQYDAIVEWGIPDVTQLNRLAGITQPTLVANGSNDTMIPTINSQILADNLPNARLRIYPDDGHGFLFQYPTEFAELVTTFLS